jgi:hypothetical protein
VSERRFGEQARDRLVDASAVPGHDPAFASVVDDLEVVAPELDELSRGAGDQRSTHQGRRELAIANRAAVGPLELGRLSVASHKLGGMAGHARAERLGELRSRVSIESQPGVGLGSKRFQLGSGDGHDLVLEVVQPTRIRGGGEQDPAG